MATALGEKTLLIGRRPVRNWARRTISSLFFCAENYICSYENKKTAAARAALFDSYMNQIAFYRLGLRPDHIVGAYSAHQTP